MIDAAQHGERLDRALAALVPEFSRSYLQQLIEAGGRAAQRRSCHAVRRSKVKAGDAGEIELRPTPQSQAFRPEPMALDVVFEDEHLLVIDKPAGLVVHPAPGNWSGTLAQRPARARSAGPRCCRAPASCTGWTRTPAA